MKHVRILPYLLFLLLFFNGNVKTQSLPIVSGIYIGHIALTNPIITLLGSATLALSVIAHNAYQMCKHKYTEDVTGILAERSYYQERKKKLLTLRNEFLAVKYGLEAIQGLQCMGSTSFTQQFLQKHFYDAIKSKHDINEIQEKRLSDEQKEVLRKARETELTLLEKQICDIQLVLALHVNYIIDEVMKSHSMYENALKEHQKAINEWNNNLQNITDDIALQTYQSDLIQHYLLNRMHKTIAEFTLIAHYYRTCSYACIKNTTTILQALEDMTSTIVEVSKLVKEEEKRLCKNIAISEKYFASRHIYVETFKDKIKKEVDGKYRDHYAHVLKKLEDNISSHGTPGGPKKDEENKDFWERLKARSDKRVRTTRFGKMYRDPVTKLWWSKDLAGHGGSCYKVFKESAKGFEWLFDAAKDGIRIIAKHKGPTGMFIPYKDVIFKL